VWDVGSDQTLQTLEEHSDKVGVVAVLDSRRVVSGSSGGDGTLRVWDVERGRTLQILKGWPNGVCAVAVLDSRQVVSSTARAVFTSSTSSSPEADSDSSTRMRGIGEEVTGQFERRNSLVARYGREGVKELFDGVSGESGHGI